MTNVTIKSNHHERELRCMFDLPEKARVDFTYVQGDDQYSLRLFQYKGEWYDVNEFMITRDVPAFAGWHGYQSDSFFSGVLIRYTDDFEAVAVGRYWS